MTVYESVGSIHYAIYDTSWNYTLYNCADLSKEGWGERGRVIWRYRECGMWGGRGDKYPTIRDVCLTLAPKRWKGIYPPLTHPSGITYTRAQAVYFSIGCACMFPVDILLHFPQYVQCTEINWTVTLSNRPAGISRVCTMHCIQPSLKHILFIRWLKHRWINCFNYTD